MKLFAIANSHHSEKSWRAPDRNIEPQKKTVLFLFHSQNANQFWILNQHIKIPKQKSLNFFKLDIDQVKFTIVSTFIFFPSWLFNTINRIK